MFFCFVVHIGPMSLDKADKVISELNPEIGEEMKEKEGRIGSFTKWERIEQKVTSLKVNQTNFKKMKKQLEKQKKEFETRLNKVKEDLRAFF